jgi:hypothetical protein
MLLTFLVHWVLGTCLGVRFMLYTLLWLLRLCILPPLLFHGVDNFTSYLAFAFAQTPFWCGVALFRLLGLFLSSLLYGDAKGCCSR